MEQYSAASVSGIFAVPSSEENRSHLANCDDKRLNVAISTQVRSSSPPPIPTGCRSPFVSPNHPLYVFGDRPQRPQTPPPLRVLREPPPLMGRHRPIMLAAGGPILPKPTDSLTACMESLSLAARPEPPTSPYQRLAISNAFDDGEDQQSTSTSTTTRTFATEPQQVLPQQTQGCESGLVHLQSICSEESANMTVRTNPMEASSTSFAVNIPIHNEQTNLLLIGKLDEGESLESKLRRIKRRLYLDNNVLQIESARSMMSLDSNGSKNEYNHYYPPKNVAIVDTVHHDATPRHSNLTSSTHSYNHPVSTSRHYDATKSTAAVSTSTMEGMEVVLDDAYCTVGNGYDMQQQQDCTMSVSSQIGHEISRKVSKDESLPALIATKARSVSHHSTLATESISMDEDDLRDDIGHNYTWNTIALSSISE